MLPWLAAYTDAGVSMALRRLGVRRKRGRLWVHSPDADYAAKMRWVAGAVAAARAAPGRVAVLYGDEASVHRQPTLAHRWHPVGEEPRAPLAAGADTRHRFCAALDAVTGAVTYTAASKTTVAHLRRFLARVRERYGEREVVLVWDNWPVHQHEQVLKRASELRIHLLWLPTYAPWTNPIEKLWRWLRQEAIHHHDRAERWHETKAACATFLDRFLAGSDTLLRYVGLLPI